CRACRHLAGAPAGLVYRFCRCRRPGIAANGCVSARVRSTDPARAFATPMNVRREDDRRFPKWGVDDILPSAATKEGERSFIFRIAIANTTRFHSSGGVVSLLHHGAEEAGEFGRSMPSSG